MAQSVNLWGATYSDVPAIEVPKSGGGMASFTDVTDTTAAASDVATGKYFYTAAGVRTQGTGSGGGGGITVEALSVTQNGTYTAPTGKAYSPVTVSVSGGASNVVTGTFTGTTTGAAMDITLNYTGSGYPVAVVIYPSEGAYNSSGTFYNLVQRYAIVYYLIIKINSSGTPFYSAGGSNDYASTMCEYKSSASNATSHSRSASSSAGCYYDRDATSGTSVRIRSATKMSVFIAGTSYGFAANIEYKYWVLYSS